MNTKKPFTVSYYQSGIYKETVIFARNYDHACKIADGKFFPSHMHHVQFR